MSETVATKKVEIKKQTRKSSAKQDESSLNLAEIRGACGIS